MVRPVLSQSATEGIAGLGALEVGEVSLWRVVGHQLVVLRLRCFKGVGKDICCRSRNGSQVWEVTRKSRRPHGIRHRVGGCKSSQPRLVDGQNIQISTAHSIASICPREGLYVVDVYGADVRAEVRIRRYLLFYGVSWICG